MKAYSVLLIIVFSLTTNIFSQVPFTSHTIVSGEYSADGAISVYAVDVDGDGDMDVLSASYLDDKIAWYENLLIVSIDDNNPLGAPVQFQLYNNYPNPFNPATKINYQLPELSFVTVKVYDVLGSEIATLVNEEKPAGSYEVELDAMGLTSGIYFYTLAAGSFRETKKMVLMK